MLSPLQDEEKLTVSRKLCEQVVVEKATSALATASMSLVEFVQDASTPYSPLEIGIGHVRGHRNQGTAAEVV